MEGWNLKFATHCIYVLLTLAELKHYHFILKQLLYCFLHGIANFRDIMYTLVLVENESYTIRHDTANRSGARPWVKMPMVPCLSEVN